MARNARMEIAEKMRNVFCRAGSPHPAAVLMNKIKMNSARGRE